MPLYEYLCKDCSHGFEILVRGNDHRILCPKCNSRKVSKCFSTFAYRGSVSSVDALQSTGVGSGSAASGCGSCSGGNCASCR